jgi:cellulose synthase operon protein YhjQ
VDAKDHKALSDQNETPEDVATLYSWANLHGAKYRDFSASRAESREKARQHVQETIEKERRRAREEAEAEKTTETQRAVEAPHDAETAKQAELSAQQAAQEAAWQQQRPDRFAALPDSNPVPPAATPAYRPVPNQATYAPMREDSYAQPHNQWAPPEPRETGGRPAWLSQSRVDMANQPILNAPLPRAPEDTLQGSRDRLTSRWFALNSVFEGTGAPVEPAPAPVTSRAPVMAVFSLAGGVGKTSLVATLGRALSARGERVLLVDTAAYGLLPFFFGARDQRPGMLRTFSPPGASGDAPLQMVTIDPETLGPETASQEILTGEIAKYSHGVNRVIVDVATASGATTRRLLRMAPMVLVPVVPDMNSVVSVGSIDAFFQHNGVAGNKALPYYVLNQFDFSLPLHLDVREVLREQLGDRLLPFALRRAPAMSEALAEGMTVMDYAPNSTVAEDFGSLAGWVKSLSAPASTSYRGVRWSER